MAEQQNEKDSELIIGRNAVLEALKSGREINALLVAKGDRGGSIGRILADCRTRGIVVKEVDKRKLDYLCGQGNHQGVAAYAAAHAYAGIDDMFALAQARNEEPFLILCDELEDPHNLGAIIRTAEAAGAHGVIIPKRHGVALTWAVAKSAAGALEYMPVARVGNLAATIETLKKRGVWVYSADMDGTPWHDVSFSGAVALVVGAEGSGVSRLVRDAADEGKNQFAQRFRCGGYFDV